MCSRFKSGEEITVGRRDKAPQWDVPSACHSWELAMALLEEQRLKILTIFLSTKPALRLERLLWLITLSNQYYREIRAWQLRKKPEIILKYNVNSSCDREKRPHWEGNWVRRGGAYASLWNHWWEEEQGDPGLLGSADEREDGSLM